MDLDRNINMTGFIITPQTIVILAHRLGDRDADDSSISDLELLELSSVALPQGLDSPPQKYIATSLSPAEVSPDKHENLSHPTHSTHLSISC